MLREHERLDYLTKEHLRIIQNDAVFSFQQMPCYSRITQLCARMTR